MLVVPKESLQIHRVVARAMSKHTFALVEPSKHGVENQEIATGVAVKWKGQYLILTAGHVVDYCPEDTLSVPSSRSGCSVCTTGASNPARRRIAYTARTARTETAGVCGSSHRYSGDHTATATRRRGLFRGPGRAGNNAGQWRAGWRLWISGRLQDPSRKELHGLAGALFRVPRLDRSSVQA